MSKKTPSKFERELFNPSKDEISCILKEATSFVNGTRNKVRLLELNKFEVDWINEVLSTKEGAKWTSGGGIKGYGYGRFASMAKSSAIMIAWFTHRKIKKVIIRGARSYLSSKGYVLSPIVRMSSYELVFPERYQQVLAQKRTRIINKLKNIGIIDRYTIYESQDLSFSDYNGVSIVASAQGIALIKYFPLSKNHMHYSYNKERIQYGWLAIKVSEERFVQKIEFKFVNSKSKFYQKYSSSDRLAMANQLFMENLIRNGGLLRRKLI